MDTGCAAIWEAQEVAGWMGGKMSRAVCVGDRREERGKLAILIMIIASFWPGQTCIPCENVVNS